MPMVIDWTIGGGVPEARPERNPALARAPPEQDRNSGKKTSSVDTHGHCSDTPQPLVTAWPQRRFAALRSSSCPYLSFRSRLARRSPRGRRRRRLRRRTSRTRARTRVSAIVENNSAGVFTRDNAHAVSRPTVSVDDRRGLARTSHIRVKARNAITPRRSLGRCPDRSARSR